MSDYIQRSWEGFARMRKAWGERVRRSRVNRKAKRKARKEARRKNRR